MTTLSEPDPDFDFDEVGDTIKHAFELIRENLRKIVEMANQLIDRAQSFWYKLAPPVRYWIMRNLRAFKDALEKFVQYAREVLAHHTPVISLLWVGSQWAGPATTHISNMSSDIAQHQQRNLIYWEGGAARFYNEKVVPSQKEAVDGLTAKASFIMAWLQEIAKENSQITTGLAEIAGKLLGEMAAAVLEAATLIDIPLAIGRVATMVGTVVETTVNLLLTIGQRIVQTIGGVNRAVNDQANHSRFPNGAWPQAVTG